MGSLSLWLLFSLGPLLVITACFASESGRPCYSAEEAAAHAGKEICLAAHVYDIKESEDGTRFLDVCAPGQSEESCRFTVMSLGADRKEVGQLESLRDADIRLRGTVHSMHGQSVMLLSHARQFRDGAEKFRPNPELLAGFNAGEGKTAFRDPNMSSKKQHSASVFKSARH